MRVESASFPSAIGAVHAFLSSWCASVASWPVRDHILANDHIWMAVAWALFTLLCHRALSHFKHIYRNGTASVLDEEWVEIKSGATSKSLPQQKKAKWRRIVKSWRVCILATYLFAGALLLDACTWQYSIYHPSLPPFIRRLQYQMRSVEKEKETDRSILWLHWFCLSSKWAYVTVGLVSFVLLALLNAFTLAHVYRTVLAMTNQGGVTASEDHDELHRHNRNNMSPPIPNKKKCIRLVTMPTALDQGIRMVIIPFLMVALVCGAMMFLRSAQITAFSSSVISSPSWQEQAILRCQQRVKMTSSTSAPAVSSATGYHGWLHIFWSCFQFLIHGFGLFGRRSNASTDGAQAARAHSPESSSSSLCNWITGGLSGDTTSYDALQHRFLMLQCAFVIWFTLLLYVVSAMDRYLECREPKSTLAHRRRRHQQMVRRNQHANKELFPKRWIRLMRNCKSALLEGLNGGCHQVSSVAKNRYPTILLLVGYLLLATFCLGALLHHHQRLSLRGCGLYSGSSSILMSPSTREDYTQDIRSATKALPVVFIRYTHAVSTWSIVFRERLTRRFLRFTPEAVWVSYDYAIEIVENIYQAIQTSRLAVFMEEVIFPFMCHAYFPVRQTFRLCRVYFNFDLLMSPRTVFALCHVTVWVLVYAMEGPVRLVKHILSHVHFMVSRRSSVSHHSSASDEEHQDDLSRNHHRDHHKNGGEQKNKKHYKKHHNHSSSSSNSTTSTSSQSSSSSDSDNENDRRRRRRLMDHSGKKKKKIGGLIINDDSSSSSSSDTWSSSSSSDPWSSSSSEDIGDFSTTKRYRNHNEKEDNPLYHDLSSVSRSPSRDDENRCQVHRNTTAQSWKTDILVQLAQEPEPDLDRMRAVVKDGADVLWMNDDMYSPVLHHLVCRGLVEAVSVCLQTQRPIDFTIGDRGGWTPLHYACTCYRAQEGLAILYLFLKRRQNRHVLIRNAATHSTATKTGTSPLKDDVWSWSTKDEDGYDCISWAAFCGTLSNIWPVICHQPHFSHSSSGERKNTSERSGHRLIPLRMEVKKEDWERLSAEDQKRFRLMKGFC